MNKELSVKAGIWASILISMFFGILLFFQVYIDDAFIFFKFGYNLVHHGVWSYSTDGLRSEAYTSFIYALFSIFPPLLNIPAHIFIKCVGLVIFMAMLWRIYKKTSAKKWALITILLITTNWQVYVHAFSGLETLLWCWLLLEAFFIIREEKVAAGKQLQLWLLCLLLALTRPEGVIYAAFFFVYLKWMKKQSMNYLYIVIVAVLGIIYFALRYWYFGLLFPLPFYHKVMDNQFGKFAFIFNMYTSWHYLICAALVLYFLRKFKLVYYIGAVSFLIFFLLYGKSFLVMNFADRFPFQLFLPFIIFALIQLEKSDYIHKVKILLVAGFLNLIVFSKGLYNENLIELASITNNAGSAFFLPRSHYILAKNINKIPNVEQKQLKVLFGDAGVFPYYVKAKCYDYNGLTDAYMVKNKLTESYFDSRDADIVLIGTPFENKDNLVKDPTACKVIYTMAEKRPFYKYAGYTISKENGYYVHIYFKTTSPHAAELEKALQAAVDESKNAVFRIKRFLKFRYLDMDNI